MAGPRGFGPWPAVFFTSDAQARRFWRPAAHQSATASEADAEDNDHIKAKKKSHVSDSDTTSAESQADAIIDATATATGIQGDQSNTADVDQDSSIHDVDLSNNVVFGDDTNTQVAIPISDIDQRAANLDLEETITVLPPTPPTQPPTQAGAFCLAFLPEDSTTPELACFTTLAHCEDIREKTSTEAEVSESCQPQSSP